MNLMCKGRMLARARKKYGKPAYPGRTRKSDTLVETKESPEDVVQIKNTEEAREILGKIKTILKNEVSSVSYETWIDPCDAAQIKGNRIILSVENDFIKEMLERRYLGNFRSAASFVTSGEITEAELVTEKESQYWRRG